MGVEGNEVVPIEPECSEQVIVNFQFRRLHNLDICNSATVTWEQKGKCDEVETKKVTVVSKPLSVDNEKLQAPVTIDGDDNNVVVGNDGFVAQDNLNGQAQGQAELP